jgi:hypothetical protein
MYEYAASKDKQNTDLIVFQQCEEQTLMLLDEAKSGIVSPLKDMCADWQGALVKLNSKIAKDKPAAEIKLQRQRLQHHEESLVVHSKLFEKYRVQYLKDILDNLIMSELNYHCRMIGS